MRKRLLAYLLTLFCLISCPTLAASNAYVLKVSGAISPASADYLTRGMATATKKGAGIIVIQLDTPGGLAKSMRQINTAILNSTIPVMTFVGPSGARAASAGTFILYASHVAVMASGTHIGAASPVSLTGGLPKPTPQKNDKKDGKKDAKTKAKATKTPSNASAASSKVYNDAIAYIRTLAQKRGRNAKWGEKAVTDAATITASEALKLNVIDFIAEDVKSALDKASGRKVTVANQQVVTLDTKGATITSIEPDWRNKFLATITDPSVAYILLLIGVYGIFFEFANPGFIVPGVAGAICLMLAAYALQLLPISYAGLGLVILGLAFMLAEAFIPSFGALGIGGILAFIIGSIMLFDTEIAAFRVAWPVILAMAVANIGFFTLIIGMVVRSRSRLPVHGKHELIGQTSTVMQITNGKIQIVLHGEVWEAVCDTPLAKGDSVIITAVNGLVLTVEPSQGESS